MVLEDRSSENVRHSSYRWEGHVAQDLPSCETGVKVGGEPTSSLRGSLVPLTLAGGQGRLSPRSWSRAAVA